MTNEEIANLVRLSVQQALDKEREQNALKMPTIPQPQFHAPTEPKRPKPSLPDPARYNGNEPALFPQFFGNIKAKLMIDGPSIVNEYAQVWYGMGRLEGKAAARVFPWAHQFDGSSRFTKDEILKYLQLIFADPARKKNPFPAQQFEASLKLKDRLINVEDSNEYELFRAQIKIIADKLETFDKLKTGRNNWRNNGNTNQGSLWARHSQTPPANDEMDWTSAPITAINGGGQRRAKWVSKGILDQRRQRRLCYRCGASGHMVGNCPYGPAQRAQSPKRAAPVLEPNMNPGRHQQAPASEPQLESRPASLELLK
ncbi:hypothetical protein ACJ73_10270 [Blastomyces percursus]|uniref:CCHC-type domain-containing protein n=1 Tax=Blastomyces percursus TaxID=1658174 RepID=A0A1J9NZU5_9EURO|nr:hypothetical protein ACJ73_10270 [Blastomyces percursus]